MDPFPQETAPGLDRSRQTAGIVLTSLVMTKLVVGDLEKAKAFYEAVCEVREVQRIQAVLNARPITELIMSSAASASPTLVLLAFDDMPPPSPLGECMLVFQTREIDSFVERAVSAGGSIMQPPKALPEHGLSFALVRDPEGHVLEAVQLIGAG